MHFAWQGLHFGASDLQFAKMILRDRCSTSYDLQLSMFEGSLAELLRF